MLFDNNLNFISLFGCDVCKYKLNTDKKLCVQRFNIIRHILTEMILVLTTF